MKINIDLALLRGDIFKFLKVDFDAVTKNDVAIAMYKNFMVLFHNSGNEGIKLCPKCSKNIKELVAEINKTQENQSNALIKEHKAN